MKHKIITPLTIISACYAVGFLAGAFNIKLVYELQLLIGICILVGLVWMWREVLRDGK